MTDVASVRTVDPSHTDYATDLANKLSLLSLAISDPKVLLRKLAEYAVAHPDRVDSAYWMTLDGTKDAGFQVRLWSKATTFSRFIKRISVGGLLGAKSAGLNLYTPVYEAANGIKLEIGIGETTQYDRFASKWSPVVTLAFKIPLS